MPGARLIVDTMPEAGTSCRIRGPEVSHAHARRMAAGDPVVLVDGSGREGEGRLTRVGKGDLEVQVDALRIAPPDPIPPIHLLTAGLRGERLAWIAEKATELGAARLTIVSSLHTQSFRSSEALLPRLSRVVREAAKQSELSRWPELSGPRALEEVLASEPSRTRLLLDPAGEPFPRTLPDGPSALLVGPEGGFSGAERAAAVASGWIPAALPAGKLRAETAAVAALVLARAALTRNT